MVFALVYLLLLRLLRLITGSSNELTHNEVEVVVLRHQLVVLKRQVRRPRLRRRDRLFMAAISRTLPRARWSSFLVAPRCCSGGIGSWSGGSGLTGARPWAADHRVLLRRNGLGPAPRRAGPTWSQLLRLQAQRILALDFFTVETAWLRTLYVLPIHLGSRRVNVLGVTQNPDSAWVTQQARNLAMGERFRGVRFVIRDRDAKFSGPFDEVLLSEGIRIVKTPIQAPRANAFAERWVRTARRECLDWTLVFGRRHLERILRIYTAHFNGGRPHRGFELGTPEPRPDPLPHPLLGGRVRRRDLLSGHIHEYELAA